jgi:hypothetical protein
MLDDYSKEFADALFARFPEWRDASSTRRDRHGRAYLHVGVARPVDDDPVGGLAISTEDEEVTIECGRHWHGHFDWESFDDQLSSEVLDFLAGVLAEEHVFVRFQLGDSVLGGKRVDRATARALIENGPPPKRFTSDSASCPTPSRCGRGAARSTGRSGADRDIC